MFALLSTLVALAGAPDPSHFSTRIDNPYWPMRPGSRWVYRETDTDGSVQRIVVTVARRTKRVASGVTARIVHDRATEDGQVVENTFDYYAQDRKGNVWYLGEDTTEYENGKPISKAGSWEAGVDGAEAGIAMLAHPRVGRRYRQEHYPGHAEDGAKVLSRTEQAEVPFGHFRRVLLTKDFNPLKPMILEYKLYARGVGPVLEVAVSGGSDRAELLRYRRGTG
jgi:hypothetical protein